MQIALFWTQAIATIVIAATLVVYILQLKSMRHAATAQNILSLVQYLQDSDIRKNRTHVITHLKNKEVNSWNDEDKKHAAAVCSSYDVAAILVKEGLVPLSVIAENWGPSIRLCYEACYSYHQEMQNSAGPEYWNDLPWLYERVIKILKPMNAQPDAAPDR